MLTNEKHAGGSFDDFLKQQGIFEAVQAGAAKKRLAIQFQKEMKRNKITKTGLNGVWVSGLVSLARTNSTPSAPNGAK
jgi:hypothetical protein